MKNLIDVRVDKRTELMSLMLMLSDYYKEYPELLLECNNKTYRDAILNEFSKFKNEKTIKLLNKIIEKLCFNYDAPYFLILQLDNNLTFDKLDDYPFVERLESSKLVIDFLKTLPTFSKKINFDEFYNKNKSFYEIGIKQIKNLIKDYNIVKFMNDFYNMDLSKIKFVINLMCSATSSNYGTNHNNEFVCNSCLRKSNDGKINFIDEKLNTLTLYVHEFSHSIINPLTTKYNFLKDDFFNDIKEAMKKMHYNLNEVIIDEHIIRAIEIIYLKCAINNEESLTYAQKLMNEYKEIGFKYIEICIKSLEKYYLNKSNYKSFEEYFPQILKDFKNAKN